MRSSLLATAATAGRWRRRTTVLRNVESRDVADEVRFLCHSRMTIRIPVEKIRRAQDADPLLFMGENPDENFHAWGCMRIQGDGRFTEKGVEGVVHVRLWRRTAHVIGKRAVRSRARTSV